MGHLITGFLLTLQFFSIMPVKKELRMEKGDVTVMYAMLPVAGVLFGGIIAGSAFFIREYTDSSALLLAFVIVIVSTLLTGGLHLDGLADVGDAFFSYQERSKRLEIMEDPRIGAFGTMVLLFTVIGKVIMIAEIVATVPLFVLVMIPWLSRSGLLLLFSSTETAKETGLASFFRKRSDLRKIKAAAWIHLVLIGMLLILVLNWLMAVVLITGLVLSFFRYRKWCRQNFGGVSGDLFGAFIEGVEFLLWILILFLI